MSREKLKKILLVEDDTDIQEITKMALASIGGFEVDVCSSGVEALANVVTLSPQLILLDVMMPDMDGIETLEKLRQIPRFSKTPVIFLTAKVQPAEVKRYMELGVSAVLCKPFDPMMISQNILDIWNRHPI